MELSEIKKLAVEANNETWKYLSKTDLGQDEKVQMLNCAYASLYLWARAGGTALNFARGHWLISRVLCVLEEADLADHHTKLCRYYTEQADGKKDFEDMYVIEAEARVAALKGDRTTAAKLKAEALRLAALVKNPEDRKFAELDVRAEPWFGI